MNILDNAKKHSYESGEVFLEAAHTTGGIHITVSDEGEGIPEEDLPHIWDRLYRVEKSRSRESGGSGLVWLLLKRLSNHTVDELLLKVNGEKGPRFG